MHIHPASKRQYVKPVALALGASAFSHVGIHAPCVLPGRCCHAISSQGTGPPVHHGLPEQPHAAPWHMYIHVKGVFDTTFPAGRTAATSSHTQLKVSPDHTIPPMPPGWMPSRAYRVSTYGPFLQPKPNCPVKAPQPSSR